MGTAVKNTISLPRKLAKEVEDISREERKPLSAVIQDALQLARKERIKRNSFRFRMIGVARQKEKDSYRERSGKVFKSVR